MDMNKILTKETLKNIMRQIFQIKIHVKTLT